MLKKGFTLVELLIVIAILGVLATVVIVAINPVQTLAKTRDSGRVTTVSQLGHAVLSQATGNNGIYTVAAANWMTTLSTAGEIGLVPGAVAYSAPATGGGTRSAAAATDCTSNNQNGFCYATYPATSPTRAIVYTRLESASAQSVCTSDQVGWAVWSSVDSRSGTLCTAGITTQPADPTTAGYTTSLK